MMKVKLVNNIYYLQGSTFINLAIVLSMVDSNSILLSDDIYD
jgi:hypothetical protein